MDRNNKRDSDREMEKRRMSLSQLDEVSGGDFAPGKYQAEAMAFIKSCLGEEKYARILGTAKARQHPYVAARLFLSPADWEKYVYIEQNGTLDGYPG